MTSPATSTLAAEKSGIALITGASDVRQPIAVGADALALHELEIGRLQLLGDRPAPADADRAIVGFADRRDFRSGAREERLVGHVELVARDAALDHLDAHLLRELHDRATR